MRDNPHNPVPANTFTDTNAFYERIRTTSNDFSINFLQHFTPATNPSPPMDFHRHKRKYSSSKARKNVH